MKPRTRFRPEAPNQLEDRLVLSRVHPAKSVSVVVSGLYPGQQVLTRQQQSVAGEVNQAFDSFQSDYDQARATYFASIANNASPDANTKAAFTLYTTQRVTLLANQIISSFLQYPQGTARAHGAPSTLKTLVNLKIITPQGTGVPGSLANSLLSTIPQPGTSAATASLYSLSQDNAIEAARVAVINGVSIVKSGAFGNKSISHH